ncbi:putative aminotransferase [Lachnellula occidentalis]|uniref:Putative aminotransferase n=1 Tax=Lachnellula occidentalis TaxID=215460 RepID=A0A8H8UFZ7_9HELO|nr:putative aminotransferase [Lachnellula occidentalis]
MAPSAILGTAPLDQEISIISSNTPTKATRTEVKHPEEPALLHRSLLERPHNVSYASGSYMTLKDGRKILDGCGGAAVAIIGHGNEEVLSATLAQMRKVSYVHTLSYTTDAAEDLANFLLHNPASASKHSLEKAYFVGSGSEANDAAMKLARQYFFEQGQTQRKCFVARRQGYHGNTIGAMSISNNLARRIPYRDLAIPNVSFVAPAYAYQYAHASESEAEYCTRLIAEIEAEFHRLGPQNIIAFVAEPVVGATAGCVAAPKGYFPAIRKLCDEHGVLLMLDEVMCGMGRTGTYFAFEQESVVPDIVTVGKGLGGGYAPIAAVLISGKIIDVLRAGTSAFNHGHTYQAHPVTCATALAVQNIVRREGLVERCADMGRLLEKLLRETFSASKYVGDIRGRGLFWALEFVEDRRTKSTFDKSVGFGLRVQQAAFERGVAVYPGGGTVDGVSGDHVLIAPPYNVSEVDLRIIVDTLKAAYVSIERYIDGEQGSSEKCILKL